MKTPTQRKADERNRHRALGRTPVQVWVHPEDREKVAHYIRRLNDRRRQQGQAT